MPLMDFLEERIFRPLSMESPVNLEQQSLADSDAKGYTRFGRGPLRPIHPEARMVVRRW